MFDKMKWLSFGAASAMWLNIIALALLLIPLGLDTETVRWIVIGIVGLDLITGFLVFFFSKGE